MSSEWTGTTLGACAEFLSGGTPRTSNPEYWAGTIPWISGKDLKSFYLSDAEDHITAEAADAGSRLVPAGTILLLVRGMTLHNTVPIGVVTREVAFNQDIKAIRAREHVDQAFLSFWLLARRPQLLSTVHAAGHGTGVLASDRLKALPIELPELDEQRRIANVFRRIEEKVAQNRRTGRKLEALVRATFKAWFVDFEPVRAKAAGATAFPGMPAETFATLPTRLVNSELGPVPEGWSFGKLGDSADVNKASVKTGQITGEIEYVDIASVTAGELSGVQRVDFAEAPSRARRRVHHGDTIWSCVRPNRRSYLFVHSPPPNRIASTGFAVISPKVLGAAYIYEATTRSDFVDYLVANADGSAYPAVRADHFTRADVLIPPPLIREAFEAFAMPLRDLIASGNEESGKLASLRDYLLPRLLSGRVRVREAERVVQGARA